MAQKELARLAEVMTTLRQSCPWDAQQTHRSLVPYLVEEALEVVEAIETGDVEHLREELGDLLLQVVFHAEIASETPGGFDLEQVAAGIADKLIARHPHVFGPDLRPMSAPNRPQSSGNGPSTGSGNGPSTGSGNGAVSVEELNVTWEERKAVEKGRTSVLQGIPEKLSALSKANKIIGRSRSRGVVVALPTEPVAAADLGEQVLALVARAQASGVDPEQAVRDAVRGLEARVAAAERTALEPAAHASTEPLP